jgi:hypothetical protein
MASREKLRRECDSRESCADTPRESNPGSAIGSDLALDRTFAETRFAINAQRVIEGEFWVTREIG